METIVYLTRHGETENSEADLYYGQSASPVTNKGQKQVLLLAKRLQSMSIDAIYTSPLERCIQAATLIAQFHGLDAVPVQDFIEIDHGKWEGLTRRQVADNYPTRYTAWQIDPAGNSPDDGESGYSVAGRVIPTLIGLVNSHEGKNIVIMAHNTVNRIVLSHFLGIPITEYRRKVYQYPAALNNIKFYSDGSSRVILLNDISHWSGQL